VCTKYRHDGDALLVEINAEDLFSERRYNKLLSWALDEKNLPGVEKRGPGCVEISLRSATSPAPKAGMAVGFVKVVTGPPVEVSTTWEESGTPDVTCVLCVVMKT